MQPTPIDLRQRGTSRTVRGWTTAFHATLFLALLALGACRDPKVTAYRAPKDAPEPATNPHAGMDVSAGKSGGAGPSMADTGGLQVASGRELVWTVPAGWQSRQGSSMRKATFAVPGADGTSADLAVTAFPGDVGGDAANVNRWRGQVGLPPVSEADALAAIERIEAHGLKIGIVDLVDRSAEKPLHMIGAIVPFEGATWFFKLLGPTAIVGGEKANFVAFMKTVKPGASQEPAHP